MSAGAKSALIISLSLTLWTVMYIAAKYALVTAALASPLPH